MLRMIKRALRRQPRVGREQLWSDSLYAINMTTGRWMPKRNKNGDMIEELRMQWRHLQRRRPSEVELHHVRSHTAIPGNEVADWLADTRGSASGAAAAEQWLLRWEVHRGVRPAASIGDG